eukprot:gene200-3454_t
MPGVFMAVAADLADPHPPVLPPPDVGCVHFGNKQAVGKRLALSALQHVYAAPGVRGDGPVVIAASSASSASGNTVLLVYNRDIAAPRSASGFELSTDGENYSAATIIDHNATHIRICIMVAAACTQHTAVSVRLPSPPLVANLPGHAGADTIGINLTAGRSSTILTAFPQQ